MTLPELAVLVSLFFAFSLLAYCLHRLHESALEEAHSMRCAMAFQRPYIVRCASNEVLYHTLADGLRCSKNVGGEYVVR